MLKGIIFDFDGVILETVDVKGQVFAELFSDYPDHVDEIVRFHHANGGMNRFRKFEHIYHTILRKPLGDEEKEQLGKQFSEIVFAQVVNAPFVDGAEEALKMYVSCLKLFVVSATPQDELREIIAARGMAHYFAAVLGAHAAKAENIRTLLTDFRLQPDELVFVGDALADYEGAQATGVTFVGRVTGYHTDPFAAIASINKINNLHGLEAVLKLVIHA